MRRLATSFPIEVPAKNNEERTLAAIMFTDLVGYSALAQRDEALALELLAESQQLLRKQFPRFNGREVKSTGDGFLVEFPSALRATQCAWEIQADVAAHNSSKPADRHIRVRIGLHVGEVVRRENDVYGDGVNIAARIEPLATGGGICLSDTVYAQVRNKIDVEFVRLESPKLKHIEVPMEVYRIKLPGHLAPSAAASLPAVAAWKSRGVWRTMSIAVAVALVAALLGWQIHHRGNKAGAVAATAIATNAAPSAINPKSVAVLPFVSLSADKNDEYLSDGMTEEMLNALARVNDLRVPGRASSFAFKDWKKNNLYSTVADELHVATVLEGNVQKSGDTLKIDVRLVDTADGLAKWSKSYRGDMGHLLDFQTQVAQAVVRELAVNLGVEDARELARPPTVNPEAHRLYLLGRFSFAKGNFSGFSNAIPLFLKAIELDTNYAEAYCGLADAYGFTAGFLMPGKDGWAHEKSLAQRALAIDPDLPEAHFSLGLALASSFKWQAGEKEIQLAIAKNPNLAVAYDQYAFLLTCLGRHEEAIQASKKAVDLEPLSPLINLDLGWWLMLARRYDEAIVQSHRAMQLDAHLTLAHWALGWSLLWSGSKSGAVTEFEAARAQEDLPFFEAPLGYAYAVTGQRVKAEQILQNLTNPQKTNYVASGLRVYPALGLGEKEHIYDWLNQAFEAQEYPCHFLKVDPVFDDLRSDPRFRELQKKVGLSP